MAEKNHQPTDSEKGGVWEYLRRRSELDKEIQSKFARPVTIMFTDIIGSTMLFDMRGDIEGITMLQRHNDIVYPLIAAAEGRIVKRLGDGLMVTFQLPANAIRAAMEIQQKLADFNKGKSEREQIHLRIGINAGMGIVEDQDVFGDVVNAAARVQGLAESDQILVTESVYTEARPELGTALFLPIGASELKGKLENVVLYEVIWSTEQSRIRAATRGTSESSRKLFILEISRLARRLKVFSYERLESVEETLRAYEELEFDEAELNEHVHQIGAILEAGDHEGRISNKNLEELIRLGQFLYVQLLPPQAREKLAKSTAVELMLAIDDQLIQVPWELLHDGREFLCLRFGIGRVVRTTQPVAPSEPWEPRSKLRVVMVTDPRRDLPNARKEGSQLTAQLAGRTEFQVVYPEQAVSREEFLTHFTTCDILHFAGHADYDPNSPSTSGFLLSNGRLPAAELHQFTNKVAVPRLIFFNACQSGQTSQCLGLDSLWGWPFGRRDDQWRCVMVRSRLHGQAMFSTVIQLLAIFHRASRFPGEFV